MLEVREDDIDRITEAFYRILKGQRPSPITLPEDIPDNEIRQVVDYINRFVEIYTRLDTSLQLLSKGELEFESPQGGLATLHSLKNLQANLRHLTWKAEQIAGGDFTQRIDFMGDFSRAFNRMTSQLKDSFEKIESQNQQISEAYEIIMQEKAKSDALLLNLLPASVADDLKQTGSTRPESFADVTVFFSDIVGFTEACAQLDPTELIDELNILFTAFDDIISRNQCERIKTIGDAYLAVCGMPEPNAEHARNIVQSALEIRDFLMDRNRSARRKWRIRMGIHTGMVVAGVVGVKKYIYDVFGDTINTASRRETCSEPMKINVSEATYRFVKDQFAFDARGVLSVKGKGEMKMYFAEASSQDPHGESRAVR